MTVIFGILGLQGWGKTALTTAFGYDAFLNGYKIFSNYPLSFDYTPVTTIKDAQSCRNGYLLLDEIWKWVHSRTSQSKINKEMMSICLLNRKRNISIVYNTQLPRTVDVILRDVTNYRFLPHMVYHNDGKKYVHYIMMDLLNRKYPEMFYTMPIDELGNLFNTRYEIEKLESEDVSFLEIGKKYESNCLNAIRKVKGFNATKLPNSGIGTDFKGDLLITNGKSSFLGDVKSTTDTGKIIICDPKHNIKNEMNKFIKNAKQWNMIPVLLFPRIKKSGNFLNFPNNWFVYKVDNGSYLLNSRGSQGFYSKLIKDSVILKNWCKFQ